MRIDKNYRGRIRVEGKPGETLGYMLTVHDADTGEAIENITDIEHPKSCAMVVRLLCGIGLLPATQSRSVLSGISTSCDTSLMV